VALFNDWSARDIQSWECQPFASDPAPLPYLDSPDNKAAGGFDIALDVWIQTRAMRQAGHRGDRLSQTNCLDCEPPPVAQVLRVDRQGQVCAPAGLTRGAGVAPLEPIVDAFSTPP
jgi:fumarylacetoacetase